MKIGIVMGSISDREIMNKVTKILDEFEVEYDKKVISAHRTPHEAVQYAEDAEKNGIGVIIAIAGKAAHLAGILAGVTTVPVIGVPAKTSMMGGLDSLLSVVQMPKGVPVATVAIDGGENAALLAIQILSVKEDSLKEKIKDYKKKIAAEVSEMNKELLN